jgi:2,3-bisphosphoglycerate-dependent phosphoglycerate mutase
MELKVGTLVLVRHGQSQWNRENRFTGEIDVPLSEAGIEEARKAGELLKGIPFDRAFTSMLSRAQETLRLILEVSGQTNLPVERDPALNARNYGDLQGQNKDEITAKFGSEQVHLWRRSYDVPPPNGESLKDTRERVMRYYAAHIEPLLKQGQRVLVVGHGNSLRALVMALDNIPAPTIPDLNIPTGAPIRYLIDANGTVLERNYLEMLGEGE